MEEGESRESIVGKLQREKTMLRGCERPIYDNDQEIHHETFYHEDGSSHICFYQNGERFIIDLQTNNSTPFPETWYGKGVLVENSPPENSLPDETSSQSRENDDREGTITLSDNRTLETYMFLEKLNVQCYFDVESGAWMRLPLSWEIQSDLVMDLIASIQEAIPAWKDKYSILASLRSHDYDPQKCSAAYFHWGTQDDWQIQSPADYSILNAKDETIKQLNQDVASRDKSIEKQAALLKKAKLSTKELQEQNTNLLEQIEDLKSELKRNETNIEIMAAQKPKSAIVHVKQVTPQIVKDNLKALYSEVSSLNKEKMRLKREYSSSQESLTHILYRICRAVSRINTRQPTMAAELEEMKLLYRREALQRKLLYNEVQELRGNIRVFLRCRKDDRSKCCLGFPSDDEVLFLESKKSFKFDKVFGPNSTQAEVYADTKPIITSCVDGYNVCIMAYGQTGSGKTHTMQGSLEDPGVNVRSLKTLMEICRSRDNVEYKLKASMIEIYNEVINDLLSETSSVLDIRCQENKTFLPGLVEMKVERHEDIDKVIQIGTKNRKVASTKMNTQSSRSHLMFLITVEGKDLKSGAVSFGTLTLCDLAGSERVSKTEATGQRLVEAAAINKSLTSLGQVFTALRNSQLHVPYRNSKLTYLLQNSLGGDAKACLFVMVSPDATNLSETQSTVQFGSNAQQVQLGQAKKNQRKQ